MCEVKRYYAGELPHMEYAVKAEDFDRVQAVNKALQARLTVQDQREDDLKVALRNAEKVIGQFMPNVGKCFGIDFLLLNETLCAIGAALNPTAEAASHVDCGSCRNITDGCKGKCQRAEEWSKP